jgi:iron complex outermembrane receptor protein
LLSAFLQDEIKVILDRVHLTLGAKIEHNDYTGFEFQPGGRLGLNLSERQTLWAAISRAVRTPSRLDTDLFAPGTPPYAIAGGPKFVSEELLAYELGYRVQPLTSLSLSVAAFYNDYDNLRSVEQLNPPAAYPSVLANGQKGRSYGTEWTAEYLATDRWQIKAGYTELQLHIRPKAGSTDTTLGSAESHDPNHQFFLRSSLDLPRHVQLDTSFRYVGRITNQGVPAYGEMDVRIAVQPVGQVELSLVGQNLLHAHHPEFGALAIRQEIERAVYGKAIWRF